MNAYYIPGKYTIDQAISESFGINEERLKAQDRLKIRVETEARQCAMWLRHYHTKDNLAAIGKIYGGRDHATVLYAVKTVNNLIETDKIFREKVEETLKLLELTKN